MNNLKVNIPYNCWLDNKGFVLPKSPIIRNTKEVTEWIKNNANPKFGRMFTGDRLRDSGLYHEEEPWLYVGISCSRQGYVYAFVSTGSDEQFEKYFKDNQTMKNFDSNLDGFKKYLTWCSNLGPKFTKQFKNKNHE